MEKRILADGLANLAVGPAPEDSTNVTKDLADRIEAEVRKGNPLVKRIHDQSVALTAHVNTPHAGGYSEEEVEGIAVNAVLDKLGS